MEGDPAEAEARPAIPGNDQGVGGTRLGTRHLRTRDTSHLFNRQKWRSGGEPAFGANVLDGCRRAGRGALPATSAGREKLDFGAGPRWPDVALLHDAIFRGTGGMLERAAKGLLEERAPIAARRLHLMTGENDTIRRLKPMSLNRCANAHCASLTKTGKSSRDVHVVLPTRCVIRNPTPASASQRFDVGR